MIQRHLDRIEKNSLCDKESMYSGLYDRLGGIYEVAMLSGRYNAEKTSFIEHIQLERKFILNTIENLK